MISDSIDCHPEPGRLNLANGGEGSGFEVAVIGSGAEDSEPNPAK